jgi:hypothetical protein
VLELLADGLMPGTVRSGPLGHCGTLGLHDFLPFLVLFGGTFAKRGQARMALKQCVRSCVFLSWGLIELGEK